VLGRWDRQLENSADFSLQVYYDYTQRDIPHTYKETRDTLDVDFQHHFRLGERNDVLWGVGFRWTADELVNTLFSTFDPDQRDDQTLSAFFQDKIELRTDRLFLTVGSKFEDNDYSGFESQPNARLTWLVSERQTFWSAVSRAVRIPSRLDTDLRLTLPFPIPGIPFPVYVTANGSRDFDSEELSAYEVGYRIQTGDSLSFDLAAFDNNYDHLSTVEPQTPILVLVPPLPYILVPNMLDNNLEGESTGGTFAANWQPLSNWRLRFQYAYLDLELATKPGSLDTARLLLVGNDPKNQLSIHSFVDLPRNLSLYTGVRYVDDLPNQGVRDYTAVDATLVWQPRDQLRALLAVQNLNDDRHLEFGSGSPSQIERSAFIKVAWSF
jgi:iron complex outermembrane receptor protein